MRSRRLIHPELGTRVYTPMKTKANQPATNKRTNAITSRRFILGPLSRSRSVERKG